MWAVNEKGTEWEFCFTYGPECTELHSSEVCRYAAQHLYALAQRVETPAEGSERPTMAPLASCEESVEAFINEHFPKAQIRIPEHQPRWHQHATEDESDPVNSPSHYTQYPVEVIEITERLSFLMGNIVKYVLRADYKGKPIEDLKKARWYLDREIQRRESL